MRYTDWTKASWLVTAAILFFNETQAVAAGGGGRGTYAPIVQVGINIHTGDTGKSLTGAKEYFGAFSAEKRSGYLRLNIGIELAYSSGSATFATIASGFSMFGGSFLPALHVFPIDQGRVQPFVGGVGVLGWNYLKMDSPPTGVENHTEGISFGYGIDAGVDLRIGASAEGKAIRIGSAFWSVKTKLAGQSGFQLNGFRISVGLVY